MPEITITEVVIPSSVDAPDAAEFLACVDVRTAVNRHDSGGTDLDYHADELLPVWLEAFGPDDHDGFARRLRRATPVRDISVMVPWLLEAAPDPVKAEAWREVPLPVRAAYRLWWKRSFSKRFGTRHAASLAA